MAESSGEHYTIDLSKLPKNGLLYVVPFVHDVPLRDSEMSRRVVTIYLKNYSRKTLVYRTAGKGAIDGQAGTLRGGEEHFLEAEYTDDLENDVLGVLSLWESMLHLDKLMVNIISINKAVHDLEHGKAKGDVDEQMASLHGGELNAKVACADPHSEGFPDDAAISKIRADGDTVVTWILNVEAQILIDSFRIEEPLDDEPEFHWSLQIIITVCVWFQIAKDYFDNLFF